MEDIFDDSTWNDIKIEKKTNATVSLEDDFWEMSLNKKKNKEKKIEKEPEISQEELKNQEVLNSINPDDLVPSTEPLTIIENKIVKTPEELEEILQLKKHIENLEKSLKIFEENEKTYKKEIENVTEKLFLSNKIPIFTTNGGTNLQIVGKNLTQIPNIYQTKLGNVIESIDLSYNQIKKIENIEKFTKLVSLVLDHNKIRDLDGISNLKKLNTLWLNHNSISSMDNLITNLKKLPDLNSLSLLSNPICPKDEFENQIYRYTVMSGIPQLTMLDSLKISKNEKVEATKRKTLQKPDEKEEEEVKVDAIVELKKEEINEDFNEMMKIKNTKKDKKVFETNEFSFETKQQAKSKNFDW